MVSANAAALAFKNMVPLGFDSFPKIIVSKTLLETQISTSAAAAALGRRTAKGGTKPSSPTLDTEDIPDNTRAQDDHKLATPPSNTAITMPLKSFHLFPTLPNELQMLIWFHAIGHLRLDMNFLRHLSNSRSGRYLRLSRSELITYATRITLMATCRLTRLLALQAMRNDIARVWISLAFPEHKSEHLQLGQWSVLKVVDGCIKEVKARMEGIEFKKGMGIIMW